MTKAREVKTLTITKPHNGEKMTIKVGHKYVHGSIGVVKVTKIEMHSWAWKAVHVETNTGKEYVIEGLDNTGKFKTRFLFEVE